MNTWRVEVGVATARPPSVDATIFFLFSDDFTDQEAELLACQWAGSHDFIVMPTSSIITDWPDS